MNTPKQNRETAAILVAQAELHEELADRSISLARRQSHRREARKLRSEATAHLLAAEGASIWNRGAAAYAGAALVILAPVIAMLS